MVACADETIWNKSLQPKDLRKTRTQLLLKPLWGCGERIKAWSYNDLRVQANHLIESQIFFAAKIGSTRACWTKSWVYPAPFGRPHPAPFGRPPIRPAMKSEIKASDFVETWLVRRGLRFLKRSWKIGAAREQQTVFNVPFRSNFPAQQTNISTPCKSCKTKTKTGEKRQSGVWNHKKFCKKKPTPACLGGGSSVADDSASEPGPGGGSAASSSLSSSSTCSARRTLRTMARCLAFPVLPTVARLACSSRLREPKCVYWALVSTTSLCRNMFLWVFATSEVKSCKGHLRKKQWRNHKFKHVAGSWKSKTLTKQDGEDGDSNLSLVTPTCLQHGRLAAISQGLHHQAFGTLASTLHHLKSSVPNPRFEEVTSEPTFFAGENTWK